MKQCKTCRKSKPLSDFWKHSATKDGRDIYCAECARTRRRAIYQDSPESRTKARAKRLRRLAPIREYDRTRTRERYRKFGDTQDPYKRRARTALQAAVKSGKVNKPKNCQGCGWTGLLHGHHHKGYDRPLDVEWLCAVCHGERHRKPILSPQQAGKGECQKCGKPRSDHFFEMHSTRGHCAKCGKAMQFADGICFECNGGRDPGD